MRIVILSILAVMQIGAAEAQCTLKAVASINAELDGDGLYVPAKLNGRQGAFQVGADKSPPSLFQDYVSTQKFETHPVEGGKPAYRFGAVVSTVATVPNFQLGPISLDKAELQVLPSNAPKGVVGELGMWLKDYDVEFNVPDRKINLFSQDHCPGKVAYWTSDQPAAVPIINTGDDRVIVNVTLDGKPLRAMLVRTSGSIITVEAARRLLGVDIEKEGLKPSMTVQVAGKIIKEYLYPFKKLTFGSADVDNPFIAMADELEPCRPGPPPEVGDADRYKFCDAQADISIGTIMLQHLRFFIETKEGKIYFTHAGK